MGCATSSASAFPVESANPPAAVFGDEATDAYVTITSSMGVKGGSVHGTKFRTNRSGPAVNVTPTDSLTTTASTVRSLRSSPRSAASLFSCSTSDATAFADAYTLEESIGKGGFGVVHSASQSSLGRARKNAPRMTSVAVKVVVHPSVELDEAQMWRIVGSHKHCIRLYETFVEPSATYMVMEKAQRCLPDELVARKLTSEKAAGNIFGQMLFGIAHCHRKNVIHRDIKPENFLVTGSGEGCVVKLADFGFAAMYHGELLDGTYGSAPFLAPEMVRNEGHDMASDVWAFGATAYKLLYGEWVYMPRVRDSASMKEAVRIGMPLPRFTYCDHSATSTSSAVGDLGPWFREVLIRKRAARPSANEAHVLLRQRLSLSVMWEGMN